MSERPPRTPDDLSLGGIVDEVVSQVRTALDEADVSGRQGRDLLLDGLRDVMQAIDPASLVRAGHAAAPPDPSPAPDVTVVDGGRSEDAPPTPGPKPDLKVATDAAPEPSSPRVYTKVTVHKSAASSSAPRDDRPGLNLPASGDTPEWRSLFRGSTARPYRIIAEEGRVSVRLDGEDADTVHPGASLDVEARVIQVAAIDAPARVRFERLPG